MYDVAIIGSGPAGLEAALNCKIRNKNIILFGNSNLSAKLLKAPKIDNYLGIPGVSGADLRDKFLAHLKDMDINITEERINAVYAMGDYYALMVNEKMYEAKTVIIATGIEYAKPYKGEEDLLGKGVGYCATCDAPLYKNKDVIVIGKSSEAEAEARYVKELCSDLYYVPLYKGEYKLGEGIKVVNGKPLALEKVEDKITVTLDNGSLTADGVFILRDALAPNNLVPGLEIEGNFIKVDKAMRTNLKGCFAAGDCTGKPYKYIKSAGEGAVAAMSAVEYLDNL